MGDGDQGGVAVSRRIEFPADEIFVILSDPARHPEFDGSGMLRAGGTGGSLLGVGDVFTMKMHNDEMGDYEMDNHLVEFETDRRIGWEPSLSAASRPEDIGEIGARLGHRWSYELEPDGEGATVVTERFDCARAPEWLRTAVDNGRRWEESMTISLAKLEGLLAQA
jgi:hypothetical protein